MTRNDKITLVSTLAVSVGSMALFAAARMKARNYIWNTQIEKNDTIKTVAVNANSLTA